ncbi:hypothetical protein D778_02726 [Xanthomarina gelatinilytica]|uniref:Flavodoxin-like domain-containing protein n=1 Tax=Xanthomarina gelatinilytica TaxID=1137281 RepID=M7MJZ1_9FLAO|nr:hypothetical protein [Xanthomarina gelatinilytica]EMQ95205.1 hypothetical protein D778_02726 [Xanthomarina gelatinilytica]
MPIFKKLVIMIVLGILGLVLYALFFYNPCNYSHKKPNPDNKYQLLIANEGSHFKDSVVSVLTQHYSSKPVNIKIIPLSALSQIEPKEYHAIVLLFSWYTWKPPPEVEGFVHKHHNCLENIVSFSTSFYGNLKMKELDGITGASKMSDANGYAQKLIEKINPLLNIDKQN